MDEDWDEVGQAADTIDNLIAAMMLPMSAEFHLTQLRVKLPEVRDRLRAAVVSGTGENPWEFEP